MPSQVGQGPPSLHLGFVNVGGLRPDTWDALQRGPIALDSFDIFCIGETWLSSASDASPFSLHGYAPVAQLYRPAPTHGRPHGGLLVFQRQSTSHAWGPIHPHVHVDAGILTLEIPALRLACLFCYFAPASSAWVRTHSCPLDPLIQELSRLHIAGLHTILMGDINAKLGSLCDDVPAPDDPDYAEPDPLCQDIHAYTGIPYLRLCSSPATTDARGLAFLDVMRATQMVVLNGRAPGSGNSAHTYTSIPHGSSSTLDFACISARAYSWVQQFDIHAYPEQSLDHSLLALSLAIPTPQPSSPLPASTSSTRVYRPPIHLSPTRSLCTSLLTAWTPVLAALAHDMQHGLVTLSTAVAELTRVLRHVGSPRYPQPDAPGRNVWWDATCADAKATLRMAHRAYLAVKRQRPHVSTETLGAARQEFVRARVSYKSLCRYKKEHWASQAQAEHISRYFRHPKQFWSTWKERCASLPTHDMATWHAHFRELLETPPPSLALDIHPSGLKHFIACQQSRALRAHCDADPSFLSAANNPLSIVEVGTSLSALRRGAAADMNGLTCEALLACWMPWLDEVKDSNYSGPDVMSPHILFRYCLTWALQRMWTDPWPSNLCCSTLSPIPKTSPPSRDPRDYRGIAVSNIFTKLFEHILFTRADALSETHGMRAVTECGFRQDHGTLDAIFTVNHLITRARHAKRRLIIVFVDFKQAFDMPSRTELLACAERLGFHGDFMAALSHLYDQVLYKVHIAGCTGPPISSKKGTKQGSHISPLLFGWLIEQLHILLMKHIQSFPDLDTTLHAGQEVVNVPDVLYADDTTLIAGITVSQHAISMERPQRYMDALSHFAAMFGLEVNEDKTKFMEFRTCRAHRSPNLYLTYQGRPLTQVSSFQYMGVLWQDNQHIHKSHMPHAYALGLKALFAFWSRCKHLGIHQPDMMSRLFRVLVRSSFTHGCQIWGVGLHKTAVSSNPCNNILDKVQLMFLRSLAGVGSGVKIDCLLHEFGHSPISHHCLVLAARFWNAVVSSPSRKLVYNALLSDVALSNAGCKNSWSYMFLSAMASLNLCSLADVTPNTCVDLLFDVNALVGTLRARTRTYLAIPPSVTDPRSCDSSQVIGLTYRTWVGMSESSRAPYLTKPIPAPLRKVLTRLRLQCAPLLVNTGRHTGLSRASRLCKVHTVFSVPTHPYGAASTDCVEDLQHFLLECPAYDKIRCDPYFAPIFTPLPSLPSISTKLLSIFTTPHQYRLAVCINRMFTLRASILTSHLTMGSSHPHLPQTGHVFRHWWATGDS